LCCCRFCDFSGKYPPLWRGTSQSDTLDRYTSRTCYWFFVILIINILSAALGHGGWGLIGANLLINVIEVVVAYTLFRGLKKIFSGAFARGGIATLASLFCGNLVMIAIILVSGVQGVTQSTSQMLVGLSLLAGVNMGVAIIEAVITGMIITYIIRMRPDMLESERP